MEEVYLEKCRCGGEVEFVLEESASRIFARCSKCGIRTPNRTASLETSAKKEVADIWNNTWLPVDKEE